MIKNKIPFLFSAVFLVLFSQTCCAQEETCGKNVESLRANALTALHRFDENFRNAGWNYRKYQELVYNPLWEAVVKRRDTYSKERQTEGEVLYRRYRLAADQRSGLAESDLENAFREFETVKRGMVQEDSCGGALKSAKPGENISQFNNCMSLWNHGTGDLILAVEKLLKRYQKKQKEFSELLEAHLSDNPSEHDTFEDRYYNHFYEFDLKTQVLFLRLIHQIRERFELSWPAEECCAVCKADQKSRWDPVLSQVKPDPQGDAGVAGNLVNNARLKQAFERFEKEQAAAENETVKS